MHRYLNLLAVLPASVLLFILVSSGRFPLDGDSVCFIPTAESIAKGSSLVNRLYEVPIAYSPTQDGRLIWHGFLAPFVLGTLAHPANYTGILFALGIVGVAAIVVWAVSCQNILEKTGAAPWKQALLLFGGSFSVAGIFFGNGRPETISALWVCLACAAVAFIRSPAIRDVVSGATLALLAVTTPIAALICGLAYGMVAALTVPPRRWFVSATISTLAGLIVFAACLAIYPYGLKEWIEGMRVHAKNCVVGYVGSQYLYYWFVARPMLGGVVLVAVGVIWALVLRAQRFAQKITAAAFGVLLLFSIAYFAPDARNYNILPLLPAAILLISRSAVAYSRNNTLHGVLLCVASALLIIAGGADFMRCAIIATTPSDFLSFEEAKSALAKLDPDESVSVSSGLFSALPTNTRAKVIRGNAIPNGGILPIETKWLFLQQINPARTVPPLFSNYRLVEARFSTMQPTLFHLKIANSPRGYNFALYEKIVTNEGGLWPAPGF